MTISPAQNVSYDPYDVVLNADPYPMYRRMREEAPLYYNEKYNFYALSRYEDVARELPNWETYRSGRGTTADILFSNIEVPPGILLFEDPPLHDLHRKLLSRHAADKRAKGVRRGREDGKGPHPRDEFGERGVTAQPQHGLGVVGEGKGGDGGRDGHQARIFKRRRRAGK